MKNKEFYAYCRDNRSAEPSLARREALYEMYNFMRECGMSKKGILQFIDHQTHLHRGRPHEFAAYQWLLSVFEGPSQQPSEEEAAGQLRLFEG